MAEVRAQAAAVARLHWQGTAAAMHAALDDADHHATLLNGEALAQSHAHLAALGHALAGQGPPRHEVERLRLHLAHHRATVVALARRLTTILGVGGTGRPPTYGPEASLRSEIGPGFLAARA